MDVELFGKIRFFIRNHFVNNQALDNLPFKKLSELQGKS